MVKYPIELQDISLDTIINEFLGDYHDEFQAKGLEITTNELINDPVYIDPEQCKRVLYNIVVNSAKYKNQTSWSSRYLHLKSKQLLRNCAGR